MSVPDARGRSRVPDWGAPRPAPDRTPLLRVLGPVVVFAGGIVLAARGHPLVVVSWILIGVAGLYWATGRAAGEGEAWIPPGAAPAPEGSRLERLVTGVSGDLGIPEPEAWIFAGDPVNAVVARRRSGYLICVSSEVLDSFGLTELEAVVTHCLARVRAGVPDPSWSRWVPGWTRRVAPCKAAALDAVAASVTRYPPGLASAIRRSTPRDGRDQGLWFVPRASGTCSPAGRADALADL